MLGSALISLADCRLSINNRSILAVNPFTAFMLFLRFQLLRGVFNDKSYRHECGMLRAWMEKQQAPHWREFLSLWNEAVD